jgi:formate-dependent nitrite reductase cytochrome c552 subunit
VNHRRCGNNQHAPRVGTERMLASGYFRAKMAQEKLIEDSV